MPYKDPFIRKLYHQDYLKVWALTHPNYRRDQMRRLRAANPERRREVDRAWRKNNPEKVRASRERLKDWHREYKRRWIRKNREQYNARCRKYYATAKAKREELKLVAEIVATAKLDALELKELRRLRKEKEGELMFYVEWVTGEGQLVRAIDAQMAKDEFCFKRGWNPTKLASYCRAREVVKEITIVGVSVYSPVISMIAPTGTKETTMSGATGPDVHSQFI